MLPIIIASHMSLVALTLPASCADPIEVTTSLDALELLGCTVSCDGRRVDSGVVKVFFCPGLEITDEHVKLLRGLRHLRLVSCSRARINTTRFW